MLEGELSGPVNLASPNPATSAAVREGARTSAPPPDGPSLPAFTIKTLFGERGEAVLLEGQRALPARLLDAGFTFAFADLDAALEHALAG